jgi:hypothetical protein
MYARLPAMPVHLSSRRQAPQDVVENRKLLEWGSVSFCAERALGFRTEERMTKNSGQSRAGTDTDGDGPGGCKALKG